MALLDYQIQFGDLILPDEDGRYELVSFEPLNSPAIRTSDVDKPLDHGEFPGIDLMKGRNFVLTLEAWNEDVANILRAFVPGKEQTMEFQHPDLGLLECRCRVRNRVGPRIDVPSILGKQVITVQFHSTDPRWYGIENILSSTQVQTLTSDVVLPNALEAGAAQLSWFDNWYQISDKNDAHGWNNARPTYTDRTSILRVEEGTDRETIHLVYEDSDHTPTAVNTINDRGQWHQYPTIISGLSTNRLRDIAVNSTHIFTIVQFGTGGSTRYQVQIINKSSGVYERFYTFSTLSPYLFTSSILGVSLLGVAATDSNLFVFVDRGTTEYLIKTDISINDSGAASLSNAERSTHLPPGCIAMDTDGTHVWTVTARDVTGEIQAYNVSDLSRSSSDDVDLPTGESLANYLGFAVTTSHYYLGEVGTMNLRAFNRSDNSRDSTSDYVLTVTFPSTSLSPSKLGFVFDEDNTIFVNYGSTSNTNLLYTRRYTIQRGFSLDTDYLFLGRI